MGKILDRVNAKLDGEHGERIAVALAEDAKTVSDAFDLYEQLQKKGSSMEVRFDACNKEGTFTVMDSKGVLIVLEGETVVKNIPYFKPYMGGSLLGMPIAVTILKVDRENRCIYVNNNGKKGNMKAALNREIAKEIENGKHPQVWGRITKVNERVAFVDILGYGIFGIVNVKDWQVGFVRHLPAFCKVNEFYQFRVKKQIKNPKSRDICWELDRSEFTENPWKAIPLSGLEEGSVIRVKCIDKPLGKSYWWGVSGRVPGIEILCNYNDNVPVIVDITYKCKIKEIKIDEEDISNNRFKVVPFAVIEEDLSKVAKLKELKDATLVVEEDATGPSKQVSALDNKGMDTVDDIDDVVKEMEAALDEMGNV